MPCGGTEKGPFFIGASNMSISIIGILTTVQSCPIAPQGNPSDQDCSAGKSIASDQELPTRACSAELPLRAEQGGEEMIFAGEALGLSWRVAGIGFKS